MLRAMKKRVLAALLWFYAMWYAGAMIAQLFGLSPALGPILGTAAAALMAGDPRGFIWKKTTSASTESKPSTPAPRTVQTTI
jgi:hypothetical protein